MTLELDSVYVRGSDGEFHLHAKESQEKKSVTNYDRLINKSREEMAEMMAVLGGCPLNVMTNCPKGHAPNEDCNAKRCWYDWLMQEVKE